MGCLARLGCLVVLAIACVVGWMTRSRWLPDRFKTETATVMADGWQPITPAGAERARSAIAKLGQARGPVVQTLSAGDVMSFGFGEANRSAAQFADSIAARIEGDRMIMRARVKTAELKSRLGPLAGMLGDRETVELSGNFTVIRPGLGGFVVQSAKLGAVTLPEGMIPRLIKEIDRGTRPAALPDNALQLPVPSSVGDIRIANGKVNVYKNTQ